MSKYFNGDKLSGYEDSPITYVHGNGVVMEEKFENINQFCLFICNHCDADGYCLTDCDLLEKARKMPFEKINNKWVEHNGDIQKLARYIKQYRL